MHDSNKTISSVWVGNKLSNMERLCICSFIANGHDFVLYAYEDIVNVPLDASGGGRVFVRDANEILPRKNIFRTAGVYVNFTDWFRWELMLQKGGWYVDLDTVCLRPFDFAEEIIIGRQGLHYINGAFLKFPANHEMAMKLVKACANPNKIQPWDDKRQIRRKLRRKIKFWKNPYTLQSWGDAAGPVVLSLIIPYLGMKDVLKLPHVFYAIDGYWEYLAMDNTFADTLGDAIIECSYGVHFSGSMWSLHGLHKNDTLPFNSLYEKLKRQYLV